jgi:hypothetical protein
MNNNEKVIKKSWDGKFPICFRGEKYGDNIFFFNIDEFLMFMEEYNLGADKKSDALLNKDFLFSCYPVMASEMINADSIIEQITSQINMEDPYLPDSVLAVIGEFDEKLKKITEPVYYERNPLENVVISEEQVEAMKKKGWKKMLTETDVEKLRTHSVGEVVEISSGKVKIVRSSNCDNCVWVNDEQFCPENVHPCCVSYGRPDGVGVAFIRA